MCEPSHSITQYPDDDQGGGQGPTITRLQMGLKKVGKALKKIGKFFHLSRMGTGHSESAEWAFTNKIVLPKATLYEGYWWDRRFSIDGAFRFHSSLIHDAFNSAKEYHERVVFQNIQSFRRFLEDSLRATDRVQAYTDRLRLFVFNESGKRELDSRLRLAGVTPNISSRTMSAQTKEHLINAVMGITRKRKWFKSHFADDDQLWNVTKGGIIVPNAEC